MPRLAALLVTLWSTLAPAATHQYWLAMQEEYSARRGYTLFVRAQADSGPLTLANTGIQFGVGQGTSWTYRGYTPAAGWQLDRDYVLKAVISPTSMELWVDGQRVLQGAVSSVPAADLPMVKAGYVYDNSGTPDYMVRQTALRLSTSTGRQVTAPLPALSAVPPEVYLFKSHTPVALNWEVNAGETLTGVPTLVADGHPDIFDPTVQATFRQKISDSVTNAANPDLIIGWSLGNEHEEIILKSEISAVLALGSAVPAKRALVDHALDVIHGGDLAAMGPRGRSPAAR